MSKKSEELLESILKELRVISSGMTLNTQAINDLYNKNEDIKSELVKEFKELVKMNQNILDMKYSLVNYKSSEKEALSSLNKTLESQQTFIKNYENQIDIFTKLLEGKVEKEKIETLTT